MDIPEHWPDPDTLPVHADDCVLVTSHHLTCTCGATTRAVREAKERLAVEQAQ
jgi:hypothetical protein